MVSNNTTKEKSYKILTIDDVEDQRKSFINIFRHYKYREQHKLEFIEAHPSSEVIIKQDVSFNNEVKRREVVNAIGNYDIHLSNIEKLNEKEHQLNAYLAASLPYAVSVSNTDDLVKSINKQEYILRLVKMLSAQLEKELTISPKHAHKILQVLYGGGFG